MSRRRIRPADEECKLRLQLVLRLCMPAPCNHVQKESVTKRRANSWEFLVLVYLITTETFSHLVGEGVKPGAGCSVGCSVGLAKAHRVVQSRPPQHLSSPCIPRKGSVVSGPRFFTHSRPRMEASSSHAVPVFRGGDLAAWRCRIEAERETERNGSLVRQHVSR